VGENEVEALDSSLPFSGKTRTMPDFLENVSPPDDLRDYDDPAEEAVLDPREKPMGFFDHLEELRWTLVKCAVVYVVFAVGIAIYLKEFNHLLMWPLDYMRPKYPELTIDLTTKGIMEAYTIVIQLCCLGALAPATPFFFYFLGGFVGPALTRKEKRMVVPVSLVGLLLFLLGAAFGFFLLMPTTIGGSAELNAYFGFKPMWTPESYFSLLSWLVIGVGASFEFPLVIVLLVYMRMMSTAFLKKYRRHAIVAIFVVAAVVTPTPDPFTQCMFAVPLYLLFELAIIAGDRVEKKRLAAVPVE
jgi:sec-independent protein translocase protein TatC